MLRALSLAALVVATPALAIQEVSLAPRAPSFVGASSGLGWLPVSMPSAPGPIQSFAGTEVKAAPAWAFSGGDTTRLGSMVFNVTNGPSWALSNNGFGLGMGSIGLGRADFGFTTRSTAGVMASETLMLYTSVSRTTFSTPGSLAPLPPGLALIEPPSQRMDVRAGFKMELMPGVTFGMEAGFAPATR